MNIIMSEETYIHCLSKHRPVAPWLQHV